MSLVSPYSFTQTLTRERVADVPVGYNSHFGLRPVAKAILPDERRVLRGGSWFSDAQCVRCVYCIATTPSLSDAILGFRPVAKATT